ncbi:MAG: hypothetical protein M5R36_12425 [Deltaproteobacteria bacterium]|nr:hypothetical protein [Deltaproteobacteria bacterium]
MKVILSAKYFLPVACAFVMILGAGAFLSCVWQYGSDDASDEAADDDSAGVAADDDTSDDDTTDDDALDDDFVDDDATDDDSGDDDSGDDDTAPVTWTAMDSGVTGDLYGVWGTGPSDVYAVGANSRVLHYDGVAWAQVTVPPAGTLYGVWASSPTDVYAVSENSAILHYDGATWSADVWNMVYFYGVTGTSPDNVYVVGEHGYLWNPVVLRFNGSSWETLYADRQKSDASFLHGAWCAGADDLWAVGGWVFQNGGFYMHYAGGTWTANYFLGANAWGIWGPRRTTFSRSEEIEISTAAAEPAGTCTGSTGGYGFR